MYTCGCFGLGIKEIERAAFYISKMYKFVHSAVDINLVCDLNVVSTNLINNTYSDLFNLWIKISPYAIIADRVEYIQALQTMINTLSNLPKELCFQIINDYCTSHGHLEGHLEFIMVNGLASKKCDVCFKQLACKWLK